MIRRLCLGLVFCCFLTMHGVSNAAHWMYVQRLEGTRYGPCHEFIDAESVWQDGSSLFYWSLWLLEQPYGPERIQKILRKNEASLKTPVQVRSLESFQYSEGDREVRRYLQAGMWSQYRQEALRARHYLDETRKKEPARPASLDVSLPRWYRTTVETEEYRLLVDVRSIRSTRKGEPGEVPSEFEMTVKKVWTDFGARVRRIRLNEEKPVHHRYESLTFSVLTYRFRSGEDQMMLLWQSDHDDREIPLAFFIGDAWQRMGPEHKMIRGQGLHWFEGSLGKP